MSKDKDDNEEEPENDPANKPGSLFNSLFGIDPRAQAQKVIAAEIRKRLNGAVGEKSFLDHIRTGMADRYTPLTLQARMESFRKTVGDEAFKLLAGGPNLAWAMEQWEADRVRVATEWALKETMDRVNRDDVDLPRHPVELWMQQAICLCGRCWVV